MQRKHIIWIIVIALVVAVVVYGFFWLQNGDEPTQEGGEVSRRSFLPFGIFGSDNTTEDEQEALNNAPDSQNQSAFFGIQQIVQTPVVGSTFMAIDGEEHVVYMDQESGHVFAINIQTGASMRLSNTTIPRVQEAFWLDNNHIVARYLREDSDDIETFIAELHAATNTTEGHLTGNFLPPNITSLGSVSTTDLFYLLSTEAGGVGIVTALDGKQKTVFSSPLREFLVSPLNTTSRVGLTTKSSLGVPGQFFLLNTDTGSLTHIIKDAPGLLTLLSPDGSRLLHTSSVREWGLEVLELDEDTTAPIFVSGLPEKCAWGTQNPSVLYCAIPDTLPRAELPDEWYQGKLSFQDSLWRINMETGDIDLLFSSSEIFGDTLDAINLTVSKDESYLVLTNKNDGSLWMAKISSQKSDTAF